MQSQFSASPHRQRGAALIVGLLLILVLTITAVAAVRSSVVQERMTRNAQNSAMAKEAAEAALRAGEALLAGAILPIFNGSGGFYPQGVLGAPKRWTTIDWDATTAVHPWTGLTGAPGALADVRADFIIEQLDLAVVFTPRNRGQAKKGGGTVQTNDYYRITARALGADGQSPVFLESVFRRGSVDMERTSWRRLR